jgi:hypothetical protein
VSGPLPMKMVYGLAGYFHVTSQDDERWNFQVMRDVDTRAAEALVLRDARHVGQACKARLQVLATNEETEAKLKAGRRVNEIYGELLAAKCAGEVSPELLARLERIGLPVGRYHRMER